MELKEIIKTELTDITDAVSELQQPRYESISDVLNDIGGEK